MCNNEPLFKYCFSSCFFHIGHLSQIVILKFSIYIIHPGILTTTAPSLDVFLFTQIFANPITENVDSLPFMFYNDYVGSDNT